MTPEGTWPGLQAGSGSLCDLGQVISFLAPACYCVQECPVPAGRCPGQTGQDWSGKVLGGGRNQGLRWEGRWGLVTCPVPGDSLPWEQQQKPELEETLALRFPRCDLGLAP